MRVIIDAMGGDNAPYEILKGTVQAYEEMCDADFVLVGDKDKILSVSQENGFDISRFEIVHAPDVITMEDDAILALRSKKESSMVIGLNLLAKGNGDAFVSAGNTGALFAGSTLIVHRAKGIQRAAIGTVMPANVPCLLLDAGANVSVTDEYLEQFAVMGSAYISKMYNIESPSVGLLNNGTEDCKGTQLQIDANKRLNACKFINYVGNVEANTVPFGSCNVLVTDGFTGNIFLKTVEGMGKLLLGSVKNILAQNDLPQEAALKMKQSFGLLKKEFDSAEHGGSPILGISKPVVKAHGSSDARAFKNAIFAVVRYAKSNAICDIEKAAESFSAANAVQNTANV